MGVSRIHVDTHVSYRVTCHIHTLSGGGARVTLERVMFNFPGPETGPTRSANMGQSRKSRWEKIAEAPKHRRNKSVVGPVGIPENANWPKIDGKGTRRRAQK